MANPRMLELAGLVTGASEAEHAAIDVVYSGREGEIQHKLADLYEMICGALGIEWSLRDVMDNESNESIRLLLEGQLRWVIDDRDGWLEECEELLEELRQLEKDEGDGDGHLAVDVFRWINRQYNSRNTLYLPFARSQLSRPLSFRVILITSYERAVSATMMRASALANRYQTQFRKPPPTGRDHQNIQAIVSWIAEGFGARVGDSSTTGDP
ncbi:hypothetical protein F5Y05DRAFT_421331 [Hypoxylon sp. FL0543]|nr:hypothetical protein F5Y05DRAFT_421331 [Hypoxylon sp. FL0543]